MAQILVLTTGLAGILHASFEVVRRLEAAGHRVTYACPWDASAAVQRQGISYHQLDRVDFDPAPPVRTGERRMRRILRAWRTGARRRRVGVARLPAEEFARFLSVLRPDLVLCDAELPVHIITCVASGVPIALLSQFFWHWRQQGIPPATRDMTPHDGRLKTELAWLELRWRRTRHWVEAALRSGRTDLRSVLRAYARRVGFSLRELDRGAWLWPFGYRTLPTLQMTARELEFPGAAQPHVVCVGPMVAAQRRDTVGDAVEVERLRAVISDARQAGQRILYASVSSKDPGDTRILNGLARAVAGRPEQVLILALGGQRDPRCLPPPAPNVHAFGWVPQLEALRHADLSINHGGIHTVHECLHFRVPMLVYSGQRYDQPGTAARVRFHGLGRSEAPGQTDPDRIRRSIDDVLSDRSIRERVNAMQERIEAYRRDHQLERSVEALLRTGRGSDRSTELG